MEALEIEERALKSGVVLLELRGSLDLQTTEKLSRILDGVIERGKRKVIVAFSGVTHVSSVGWGTLLKAGRQLKGSGGELKLAAMSERILKIYMLLELGHELPHLPDVASALTAFSK
jgi:anti-sigma B factor antagonist